MVSAQMKRIAPSYNEIYHGDCANLLRDQTVFPDESVNLVMTSPPYADKRKASYDSVHPDKYVDWFAPIAQQLLRILKADGSFVLNIKEHPKNGERGTYVLELILAMKKQGWFWIEEYCWYKKNCFPGKWPNRFRDSWERCLHFTKNKKFKMNQEAVMVPIGDWSKKRFKSMKEKDFVRFVTKNNAHLQRNVSNWLDRKNVFPHNVLLFEEEHRFYPGNLVELAADSSRRNHSAIFPVELPTWFIKLFTDKNDVVLDPFLGSGTTAAAATFLQRRYLGIEVKKEFADEATKNVEEAAALIMKGKARSRTVSNSTSSP